MNDPRKIFFAALDDYTSTRKEVMFLTGDLGYSFMEPFKEKYPDQFLNCGIAEQNMVGMAAGMALEGKRPIVYSGAMFLIARAYDQLRSDVCYPNLNVKFIGTGASGFLGHTHNFEKDESARLLLCKIPNLLFIEAKNHKDIQDGLHTFGPVFIKL